MLAKSPELRIAYSSHLFPVLGCSLQILLHLHTTPGLSTCYSKARRCCPRRINRFATTQRIDRFREASPLPACAFAGSGRHDQRNNTTGIQANPEDLHRLCAFQSPIGNINGLNCRPILILSSSSLPASTSRGVGSNLPRSAGHRRLLFTDASDFSCEEAEISSLCSGARLFAAARH